MASLWLPASSQSLVTHLLPCSCRCCLLSPLAPHPRAQGRCQAQAGTGVSVGRTGRQRSTTQHGRQALGWARRPATVGRSGKTDSSMVHPQHAGIAEPSVEYSWVDPFVMPCCAVGPQAACATLQLVQHPAMRSHATLGCMRLRAAAASESRRTRVASASLTLRMLKASAGSNTWLPAGAAVMPQLLLGLPCPDYPCMACGLAH